MRRAVPLLVLLSVLALVVGMCGCGGHGNPSSAAMTPQDKPAPSNSISGKVTLADGSAAEGVTVSADGTDPAPDYTAVTDRKGNYLMPDVYPGEYAVTAGEGFVPASEVVVVSGDAQVVNFVEEGGGGPSPPADWAVAFVHRDNVGRQTVWVMTADGATRKQLTSVKRLERDSYPTWTPNGKILFHHEADHTAGNSELYGVDPDTGDVTFVGAPFCDIAPLDVLPDDPDGRRVLYQNTGYARICLMDFATGIEQNLTLRISEGGLNLIWPEDGALVAWYPFGAPAAGPDSDSAVGLQGLIAYQATLRDGNTGSDICIVEVDTASDGTLVRADGNAGGPTCWLERDGDQTAPAISPDGNWVAFEGEGLTLWIAPVGPTTEGNLEIGEPTLLEIGDALRAKDPKWGRTDDTQFVVYGAEFQGPRDTYWAIARTTLDGVVEKISPDGETSDIWPDWNPNCTQ